MRRLAIASSVAGPVLGAVMAWIDRASGSEPPLFLLVFILYPTAAMSAGAAVVYARWPDHAVLRAAIAVVVGAAVLASVAVLTVLTYVFCGGSIH